MSSMFFNRDRDPFKYRVTMVVLELGWVDSDLESSLGW